MQKINDLLSSGKINGIEYYNYFKNRNDFSKQDESRLFSKNNNDLKCVKQLSNSVNGRNSNKQKSNKSKFNAYFMNGNENCIQTSVSPPSPQQLNGSYVSPILSTSPSFTNLNILRHSSVFDKKKEDAINRIIRNERIKEIRTKIYEYELLKEYQKYNDNKVTSYYDHHQQENDDDSLEEVTSVDSYCTDYGFESVENDDDFYENNNNIIPSNRKSSSPTTPTSMITSLLKKSVSYCDYLSLTDNNSITFQNGLSMDDLQNNNTSVNSRQATRRTRNIKPGHELYQIGNLNTPQTTFQLKCSIINAELKNIVNVLKQVCSLSSSSTTFTFHTLFALYTYNKYIYTYIQAFFFFFFF